MKIFLKENKYKNSFLVIKSIKFMNDGSISCDVIGEGNEYGFSVSRFPNKKTFNVENIEKIEE